MKKLKVVGKIVDGKFQKKKDSGERWENFEIGDEIELALTKTVRASQLLGDAKSIYNRFLGVNSRDPEAKKETETVKNLLANVTKAFNELQK